MDALYQPFHKRAVDLQYHFRDRLDNQYNSTAQILQRETKELVEDIESAKHPRAIEDRIKVIQQQLLRARAQNDTQALSHEDTEYLHHSYERLREDVRRLPNY